MVKANWWRPIPAVALLGGATVLSSSAGTPNELPGIALEWPLLLHLERGLALTGGVAMAVLVGVRATMGQFPFRLGQLEYAIKEMADQYDETDRFQWERLKALEAEAEGAATVQTELHI